MRFLWNPRMIPHCTNFSFKGGNLLRPGCTISAIQLATDGKARELQVEGQFGQLKENLSQNKK